MKMRRPPKVLSAPPATPEVDFKSLAFPASATFLLFVAGPISEQCVAGTHL